jgi:hypothetical protein
VERSKSRQNGVLCVCGREKQNWRVISREATMCVCVSIHNEKEKKEKKGVCERIGGQHVCL